MQVVNYRSFDTLGVPPTIQITQLPADTDPNTSGIQVIEGSTVTLGAKIADDVQVRNVELLVNGQVVKNDVSYPFDLSTVMPTISGNGSDQVTLQIEAIDTGGNTAVSSLIQLQLVRDTTPPQLISENISEGKNVGQSFRSFVFGFSKPLDPNTVSATTFQLIGSDGAAIAPASIQLRNDDREVQLTYNQLALGTYQYRIDAPEVTDRPGNALGANVLATDFTVLP